MNYVALVDVLYAENQLLNVEACLNFTESLPASHQVREGLIMANVKHDVDVFFVFEVAVESNYVFVM